MGLKKDTDVAKADPKDDDGDDSTDDDEEEGDATPESDELLSQFREFIDGIRPEDFAA